MENLRRNMSVFVLSCLKFTPKHKNMMYFLHLGQLFTLHSITMVKVLYPSHGSIASAFRDQNGSEQSIATSSYSIPNSK